MFKILFIDRLYKNNTIEMNKIQQLMIHQLRESCRCSSSHNQYTVITMMNNVPKFGISYSLYIREIK